MPIIEALLETLTASARLAYPYVSAMVEQGLTSTAIQTTLSEAGMGVRRTDLLALIRGIKDQVTLRPYIESLRYDVLPNPARLAESITTILRQYSYNVELEGTQIETGELVKRNVTVSTSELLTKQQAIDLGISLGDSATDRYGFSVHTGRIVTITRTPGPIG